MAIIHLQWAGATLIELRHIIYIYYYYYYYYYYLFIYLLIYLFIHLCIYLFIYLSIYLFICLLVYLCIYTYVYVYIYTYQSKPSILKFTVWHIPTRILKVPIKTMLTLVGCPSEQMQFCTPKFDGSTESTKLPTHRIHGLPIESESTLHKNLNLYAFSWLAWLANQIGFKIVIVHRTPEKYPGTNWSKDWRCWIDSMYICISI